MKLAKMKRNRAGRYIPREFADEIVGTLEDYDLEPEFIEGAACVLSYLTCPEGSDMHGAEFPKYLDNGLLALEAEPPAEVMSAAREVIELLKANGVEVVVAFIVRGDR